jgi:hypothetical protein
LDSTERSTEKLSWAVTARMPGTLLALMATPRPVPQMSRGPVGVAGGDEACCANRDVRVFGRLVVDPNVDDLRDMVVGLQVRAEGVLVLHSGVVGSDDDA